MKGHQSDGVALHDAIEKLGRSNRGRYEFNWYHSIKLPVPGAPEPSAFFFDRARDKWILVSPVVQSPGAGMFDPRLVSHLSDEPDTFMIVGSFHVVLHKGKDGWSVSIDVLL